MNRDVSTIAATSPPVGRAGRAAWVWQLDAVDEIVAFAAERGLDELFVHVPCRVDSHPDLVGYVRLANAAHALGIRVTALGGDADWLDDPAAVVSSWLQPALGTGLFDGIHLDIEPNVEAGTPSPVVGRFVATVHAIAESTPPDHALEADVRFWYPRVPAGDVDLTSKLIAIVDAVTVLSYRTRTTGTDGSVALTRPTARIATAANRRLRIGQETRPLGPDPDGRKQTFHGRPRSDLERAMDVLDGTFGWLDGYLGVAVHDWRGYAALADGRSSG